jgi:hypothetical protein
VEARIVQEGVASGRFEVRIEGESIQPGKLAVRDLQKLAPVLQTALERTARVLQREPGAAPGPVPRDVQQATNLLLVGIESGSANLLLELPMPVEEQADEGLFPLPGRDLGQRAMDTFVRGLHELETGASTVPDDWDNSVMEVAEELANFVNERQFVIEVSSHPTQQKARKARIAPAIADRFRVRHTPIRQPRTTRGRLFLVDLKTGRIDVEDEKGQRVQCQFPETLEPLVKQLVGEMVLVSGEEEVDLAVSRRGKLEVTSLQPAGEEVTLAGDFWANKTAAEQAREQGVGPMGSVADLAAGEVFDEGELQRFIETIREGRRDG